MSCEVTYLELAIAAGGEEVGSRADDSFVDSVTIITAGDGNIGVFSLLEQAIDGQVRA